MTRGSSSSLCILIQLNFLETSDIEIFSAPRNPYLFSEAVVVDSKEGRFGQTNFMRDEKDSRYIKVEHTSFAFLTGKFDPAKSDLVFSQKGELLGIMVNNNYAFHVKDLGVACMQGPGQFLEIHLRLKKQITYLLHLVRNYLACRISFAKRSTSSYLV